MKRAHWILLGAMAFLGAGFLVWRSDSDHLSGHGEAPVVAAEVGVSGNSAESMQVSAAAVRAADGGRLVDVIAKQIAKSGPSSPEAMDLVSATQAACDPFSEKLRKGEKVVGWVGDYLASACAGFDSMQYKGARNPEPDYLRISLVGGRGAAGDAAMEYLRDPVYLDSALHALLVAWEGGRLPEQVTAGLSEDQMSRVIGTANAAVMCPGKNGCTAERIMAAAVCLDTSCPAGISYEAAMRRGLSPVEVEAANKLRDWLLSIRR